MRPDLRSDEREDRVTGGDRFDADILVSGAGASGLVAAIALAKSGFSVICAGRSETPETGRTVALFEGSLRFLRSLCLSSLVDQATQPIRAIRLIDDTGARLPVPPLTLEARDIGLDALGKNVENARLVAGLAAAAAALPQLRLVTDLIADFSFASDGATASLQDGSQLRTRLVVAADGRRSPARQAANISARTWSYSQVAMTAFVAHRKPHGGLSVEFHTRQGPCTLVPLPGTSDHPHRSSLVWLMAPHEAERRRTLSDDMLGSELTHQTRAIFGRVRFEEPRGSFPMTGLKVNRLIAPRVALMGEAAHAFPPLAAQGLNLSLRDIAYLAATLRDARTRDMDIGSVAALQPYERARRRDIALRTSSVDVLNRSIMTDFAPIDAARGLGAVALRICPPLRRAIMREGILPPAPLPLEFA
jgi:2-octaprenyl-6-methoxyphenol hydroxylase